jgi:hypothetical protein
LDEQQRDMEIDYTPILPVPCDSASICQSLELIGGDIPGGGEPNITTPFRKQ